ncbi:MAG TPA: ornithine cyclodeaminase family protein [Actinomycetota bacterium]|nr:ornithine cyclodeaminase family protein [Actinomycetota bacterium]
MLVLTRSDVEELLDLDAMVETVAAAMADLSAGRASMPPRVAARTEDGILGVMPAALPSAGVLSTKLVSVFAGNAGTALPTHQAVIVAFDPSTGEPIALMDGAYITATRTAAGSALATRLLARSDAGVLAVLGTGVQGESHARAVPRVHRFREILIAGRSPEKAGALASRMAGELPLPVRAVASFREAVEAADVVCACTHSPEPVVRRAWLKAGTHVNSVGLTAEGTEVDGATVADSLVVVESLASALGPFPAGANDLAWPIRDGLVDPDHVHTEIGQLVAGTRPGRTSVHQITLYKSVGVAVQDAAAAALVLAAAREHGAGRTVDM